MPQILRIGPYIVYFWSNEQLKQRLSEKIPGVSPSRVLYEINGREGMVYSMAGEKKIVIEIHVCTPVGLPLRRTSERAFGAM